MLATSFATLITWTEYGNDVVNETKIDRPEGKGKQDIAKISFNCGGESATHDEDYV